MLGVVGEEVVEFERGFFGETGLYPDLAVRVRVAAAHCAAFVFEDLHVAVLRGGSGSVFVLCGRVCGA